MNERVLYIVILLAILSAWWYDHATTPSEDVTVVATELKSLPTEVHIFDKGLAVYGKEANRKMNIPKDEHMITAIDCKEAERVVVSATEAGAVKVRTSASVFEPRREIVVAYGMTPHGLGGMVQATHEILQYKGMAVGMLGQVDTFGDWKIMGTVRYAF